MEHNKADLTAALLHDQSNPIDFRGGTEGMIDFLYGFYIAYVHLSSELTKEKYKAVVRAVLKLIKERDAAFRTGVEAGARIVFGIYEESVNLSLISRCNNFTSILLP